jgi:hypothetical protein
VASTVLLLLTARITTYAIPVDVIVKVPEVARDVGVTPAPPDPDPLTENKFANEVFDPFVHEAVPVFDELEIFIPVADPGAIVVLLTDIH